MLYRKGKSKLVNVRVKEREIGKDGKQVYNDVLSCCPLIPKVKETKLVTLQIHMLSLARQTSVAYHPKTSVSEREGGKSLPVGSTLFLSLLVHKIYTMGVNSPLLPGCVTWPSGIFWENQIPCPVLFLNRSAHWSQRLG